MVTHDNNLASYADRRIRIMDGRIVGIETGGREALYEGNAEDVYKRQLQYSLKSSRNSSRCSKGRKYT